MASSYPKWKFLNVIIFKRVGVFLVPVRPQIPLRWPNRENGEVAHRQLTGSQQMDARMRNRRRQKHVWRVARIVPPRTIASGGGGASTAGLHTTVWFALFMF